MIMKIKIIKMKKNIKEKKKLSKNKWNKIK